MTEPTILDTNQKTAIDKKEAADCVFLQRLPEALEKGVFIDQDIFDKAETRAAALQLLGKAKYVLLNNRAWSHIIGCNDYADYLDPITKHDLALNGRRGSMLGCDLITDAFLAPHLRVKTPEMEGKVIFVLHEAFKEFWNDELKQFVI